MATGSTKPLSLPSNVNTSPTGTGITDTNTISNDVEHEKRDRSLRLYSKKHRIYILREFLLETYSEHLSAGDVVLDVAGGKGDLSWLLNNVDDFDSVVLDPRRTVNHIDKSVAYLRAHPDECQKRAVPNVSTYQPIAALMPQLQAKNYQFKSSAHLRIFLNQDLVQIIQHEVLSQSQEKTAHGMPNHFHVPCSKEWREYWEKACHQTIGFVTPTGKNDFSIEAGDATESTIFDAQVALDCIFRARLLVGFHPDQATDYCFQLADVLKIPLCVVPCCVFPSEFPHRQLRCSATGTANDEGNEGTPQDGNDCHNEDEDGGDSSFRPVERYDDLIQFLLQENKKVLTATLDFPGTTTARRIVLYTLPSR